jgi:hypothetical protein
MHWQRGLNPMSESVAKSQQIQTPTALPMLRSKGKRMVRLALFILGGATLGFCYYRFVGCRTGTCPISSNPFISTIYGALMGFLISGGMK